MGEQDQAGVGGAADATLAPLLWARAVGNRWDTADVVEFLGIGRRALEEQVKRLTVLGIPGRGTTWFPTWQLDLVRRQVRPVVGELLTAMRDPDGRIEALELAAWATTARADLDGLAPADWIEDGRSDEAVVRAARRSAARLHP